MAQEKNFENRIKKFLKDKGCWFIKYWAGAEYTKAGVPDILSCCGGNFVAIEVKSLKGRPSELQLYNLRQIENAGGYAWLLYPIKSQWLDFQFFVDAIIHGNVEEAEIMYRRSKGWERRKQDSV